MKGKVKDKSDINYLQTVINGGPINLKFISSSLRLASKITITEAEELLRLHYRAAKNKIMKMSIYDNKSREEIQLLLNEFMFHSGRGGARN